MINRTIGAEEIPRVDPGGLDKFFIDEIID